MCYYTSEKIKKWNSFEIYEWYKSIHNRKVTSIEKQKYEYFRNRQEKWKLSQLERLILELQGVDIYDEFEIRGYKERANWYRYCIEEQPRIS